MYIKLNVLQGGTCAVIYAYAEEYEEPWLVDSNPVRTIEIIHNNHHFPIIQTSPQQLKNYDNDYFVTFKSKVPFQEFCEKFAASEYNKSANYQYFIHNCANGAHYALKTSGIDLPMNYIKPMYLVPSTVLRVPSTILTPFHLFNIARNHKTKELENTSKPLSNIHFKMELASSKLNFWAKAAESGNKKQCVQKIFSAIEDNMQQRPHHAELYLEALTRTIDVLMHTNTLEEKTEYDNFSQSFKKRRDQGKIADTLAAYLFCTIFLTSFAMINYDISLFDRRFNIPLSLQGVLLLYSIALTKITKMQNELSEATDTPLSEAMIDLIKEDAVTTPALS